MAAPELLLEQARLLLDRGDYGGVLRSLEPLLADHPATTAVGAEALLLLATAWMGLGEADRAIGCCKQLQRSSDPNLRQQARDLREVLEAPALARPREWSVTMPLLQDLEPSLGNLQRQARRRRAANQPPPPPPPPVGATRAPLGFGALVVLLTLLAVLLGGCMQVRGELHFSGPGRLQLAYTLQPDSPRPTPWQRQFGAYLQHQGFRRADSALAARQFWQAPVLPAAAALDELRANLERAAQLGGVALPAPQLQWRERNLLFGVAQQLSIDLDLSLLGPSPGLDLALKFDPLPLKAVRLASPQQATALPGAQAVLWQLQAGALNQLELRCWRWNPLGLGGLAVAALFGLALALQALRRSIVPPLPALPS